MKPQMAHRISYFEFGPFRLDPVKRLVVRDGNPLPLTQKAFDTLLVLVQNSGRVMDKDEMMSMVWPDTIVEENNLTQSISALRKALGESRRDHKYIVTIQGRGYRFVADVKAMYDEGADLILVDHTKASILIEEDIETEVPSTIKVATLSNLSQRLTFKTGVAAALLLLVGLGVGLYLWQVRSTKPAELSANVRSWQSLPQNQLIQKPIRLTSRVAIFGTGAVKLIWSRQLSISEKPLKPIRTMHWHMPGWQTRI